MASPSNLEKVEQSIEPPPPLPITLSSIMGAPCHCAELQKKLITGYIVPPKLYYSSALGRVHNKYRVSMRRENDTFSLFFGEQRVIIVLSS